MTTQIRITTGALDEEVDLTAVLMVVVASTVTVTVSVTVVTEPARR
jgi:hypothetical protein